MAPMTPTTLNASHRHVLVCAEPRFDPVIPFILPRSSSTDASPPSAPLTLPEGIDTTTAQGRLSFHIFGAPAEFERELAHECPKAGLRAARERGRVGRAFDRKDIPQVQAPISENFEPCPRRCIYKSERSHLSLIQFRT